MRQREIERETERENERERERPQARLGDACSVRLLRLRPLSPAAPAAAGSGGGGAGSFSAAAGGGRGCEGGGGGGGGGAGSAGGGEGTLVTWTTRRTFDPAGRLVEVRGRRARGVGKAQLRPQLPSCAATALLWPLPGRQQGIGGRQRSWRAGAESWAGIAARVRWPDP